MKDIINDNYAFEAWEQIQSDENEFFTAFEKYYTKYKSTILGIIVNARTDNSIEISFNFDGKARREYAENLQSQIELSKNI